MSIAKPLVLTQSRYSSDYINWILLRRFGIYNLNHPRTWSLSFEGTYGRFIIFRHSKRFMAINSLAHFKFFVHSSLFIHFKIFFPSFQLGVVHDTMATADHPYDLWNCFEVFAGIIRWSTETFAINWYTNSGFWEVSDCTIRKSLYRSLNYIIQTNGILKRKIGHAKNTYG